MESCACGQGKVSDREPSDGVDETHGPLLLVVELLDSILDTSFATDGFSATFKTRTGLDMTAEIKSERESLEQCVKVHPKECEAV